MKIVHMLKNLGKKCNALFIYRTHVLGGEQDKNFSLIKTGNFCTMRKTLYQKCRCLSQENDKLQDSLLYLESTSRYLITVAIIKHGNKITMHSGKRRSGKDILVREHSKLTVFAEYHIFAPINVIKRWMKGTNYRSHEANKNDLIIAATILVEQVVNIYLFENSNRRVCYSILTHVLMQIKCCLFAVLSSYFYQHFKRQYIRALKMLEGKPKQIYKVMVNSLVYS